MHGNLVSLTQFKAELCHKRKVKFKRNTVRPHSNPCTQEFCCRSLASPGMTIGLFERTSANVRVNPDFMTKLYHSLYHTRDLYVASCWLFHSAHRAGLMAMSVKQLTQENLGKFMESSFDVIPACLLLLLYGFLSNVWSLSMTLQRLKPTSGTCEVNEKLGRGASGYLKNEIAERFLPDGES